MRCGKDIRKATERVFEWQRFLLENVNCSPRIIVQYRYFDV